MEAYETVIRIIEEYAPNLKNGFLGITENAEHNLYKFWDYCQKKIIALDSPGSQSKNQNIWIEEFLDNLSIAFQDFNDNLNATDLIDTEIAICQNEFQFDLGLEDNSNMITEVDFMDGKFTTEKEENTEFLKTLNDTLM